MMKKHRAAVVTAASLAALLALSGCGTTLLESKKIDYRSAGKLPPLEIPPDLTGPGADERYAVPETRGPATATYSTYTRERATQPQAGSTNLLPATDKARVERAGNQRWLVVKAPPEQVWPVVKEFWHEVGFTLKTETPVAGVMETEWAENRARIPQDPIRNLLGKVFDSLWSTAERDKFRTRLEPGQEPGTTEVYISHRGMMEVYESEGKDRTVWQPRPADPELEAEMLRRLMAKFGAEEAGAAAQVEGGELVPERAKLQKTTDGASQLTVNDPFDRAWRRVGLALDRVGFTVVDRDRSKGLYFVRYIDPQADNAKGPADKSFLAKLAFWRSDETKAGDKTEQYRIHVKDGGAASTVQVENPAGVLERSATAERILKLLHEQLK